GFLVSVIVSAFCLKVLIRQRSHFLWRDRYCAIAFLIASAVSASTDAGALGLARGVLAGVAGSGGANRTMILDMSPVANTSTTRNANTKPIPAIIRSMACDISSFIANSYLYLSCVIFPENAAEPWPESTIRGAKSCVIYRF